MKMTEYIDRKTALDIIANYEIDKYGANKYLWDLIYEIQTADVVSVVRCKDCVHHKNAPKTTDVWCERLDGLLPEDWFCADGERRNTNDKNRHV